MTMLVDTDVPRSGGRPFAAAAGAAALVVAAVAGWLLAGATAPPADSPAPPATAIAGPAIVTVPPSWTPAPERIPDGVRGFVTEPGLPARALIAFSPAPGRSLVPPGLLAGIEAELGRPRRARVAGLAAWTYGPVSSAGALTELTVVPTTGGVLGIACTSPADMWSVAMDCQAKLDGVSFDGVRPVPPAADVPFRLRLPATTATLDSRRVDGRAALRNRATRASAARRLARAHAQAASTLGSVAPSGASARLVDALRREARAYRAFGRAGRPEARAGVVAAERGLRRALAALQ